MAPTQFDNFIAKVAYSYNKDAPFATIMGTFITLVEKTRPLGKNALIMTIT